MIQLNLESIEQLDSDNLRQNKLNSFDLNLQHASNYYW